MIQSSPMPHYDPLETRPQAEREGELFARLPDVIEAAMAAPGWRRHLAPLEPRLIRDRRSLQALPVLRKSELPTLHRAEPPFGGFVPGPLSSFGRLFTSPGPIFEPEAARADPWHASRAMFAAGFRCGDVVLNTFSYHLTPGGFIMDGGARALGCVVIPAGPGQTAQQIEVIRAFRPNAYTGTPDFLNILIDALAEAQVEMTFTKAFLSGAAFPRSLQERFRAAGIDAYQAYAVADVGVVAYESAAREGLIVNEDLLLEIVRPGTGDAVDEGEVGEVVVTHVNPHHPVIRLALGDLSAVLPGPSPCGRTAMRIKGWMGRADQTAKVKGMFVRPEQIADVARRHPELGKVRLVVTRSGEADAMTLLVEVPQAEPGLIEAIAASLQAVTKLKGAVELVPVGSLPNDGKVIADERPVG